MSVMNRASFCGTREETDSVYKCIMNNVSGTGGLKKENFNNQKRRQNN